MPLIKIKGPKYSPFLIPSMIADIAAGRISIKYGFRGPNFGVVSACASSTNGMIEGFRPSAFGQGCCHRYRWC